MNIRKVKFQVTEDVDGTCLTGCDVIKNGMKVGSIGCQECRFHKGMDMKEHIVLCNANNKKKNGELT